VKMAGMEDDEAQSALEGGDEGEPVDPSRTFDSKPIWARTLVISAGVIMNLLFAVVVFSIIGAVYGEVLISNQVAPAANAPAGASAIPVGSRVVAVGGTPVTNYTDFAAALRDAPAGAVPIRLESGQSVQLQLPAQPEERQKVLQAIPPYVPPVFGLLEPASAASRAGLREGDRVIAMNGRPIRQWTEMVRVVRSSANRPIPTRVVRGGDTVDVTLTPARTVEKDANGRDIVVGKAGVGVADPFERRQLGPIAAIGFGFSETWAVSRQIGDVLLKLVTGRMSTRNLGGLIAIGEASGESARLGLEAFLGFLAMFSVNLAILNLLPIPILDGGHLMFLLAEALRGRPLSVETRVRLSQLGLIVVVALMLLANGNDVVRKVQEWMGG
jgi:regulator of sigma E protease